MLSVNKKNVNLKNLHKAKNSKKIFNRLNLVNWRGYTKKNKIDNR